MKAPSIPLLLGLAVLSFGWTVSADHTVILEFPKLPVIAGSNVTLRCRSRDGSIAYFFMNESFVGTGLSGEFTIRDVQQSHEGFYWCSTGLFSVSSKTWLSVKDPDSSPPPPSLPLFRLLCHLVVVCPYFISTVLMVSIYCSKRTGHIPAVSMEMDRCVEGGQGLAEEYDYVTATTEYNF